MNKLIPLLAFSILLLVPVGIQTSYSTGVQTFTSATIINNGGNLGCLVGATPLNIGGEDFFILQPQCDYEIQVTGTSFENVVFFDFFDQEFGGILPFPDQNLGGVGAPVPLPNTNWSTVPGAVPLSCLGGFIVCAPGCTNEIEAEIYIQNGGNPPLKIPPNNDVWHISCPPIFGALLPGILIEGTVTEIFDDDNLFAGKVSVGDPWGLEMGIGSAVPIFNDGVTTSFRTIDTQFVFGNPNDAIKYFNSSPLAEFDDSLTAFNDFGDPPFDEIQSQDLSLIQESGPTLPTADVFLSVDFFDADGDLITSPINSLSDLLNVMEDPNFLSKLEDQQILFEALNEFAVPVSSLIATPSEFSPSQFGDGVAILGTIDTIIVTRPQQAPHQGVGGEIIPIETTSLILSNTQSFSWMIPVVLSGLGIGLFVVSRKSENS